MSITSGSSSSGRDVALTDYSITNGSVLLSGNSSSCNTEYYNEEPEHTYLELVNSDYVNDTATQDVDGYLLPIRHYVRNTATGDCATVITTEPTYEHLMAVADESIYIRLTTGL